MIKFTASEDRVIRIGGSQRVTEKVTTKVTVKVTDKDDRVFWSGTAIFITCLAYFFDAASPALNETSKIIDIGNGRVVWFGSMFGH